jgi:hypothetical protein
MEAFALVEKGFENWKNKEHNKKWFKRIDGTPIPNDLMVNIAMAIAEADPNNKFSEPNG